MATKKWEYRIEETNNPFSIDMLLNNCGRDGWEAWHMRDLPDGSAQIFLKRPISNGGNDV